MSFKPPMPAEAGALRKFGVIPEIEKALPRVPGLFLVDAVMRDGGVDTTVGLIIDDYVMEATIDLFRGSYAKHNEYDVAHVAYFRKKQDGVVLFERMIRPDIVPGELVDIFKALKVKLTRLAHDTLKNAPGPKERKAAMPEVAAASSVRWIAEAADKLTKVAAQTAVNKFKNVLITQFTSHADTYSIMMHCLVGQTKGVAVFKLKPVGAKFTVVNLEVKSEIPRVAETGWRKTKLEKPTGTLNQVMAAINAIIQVRAAKNIRTPSNLIGGAHLPKSDKAEKAPTSAAALARAIKALETERDAAVKGFNDRIEALRTSHESLKGAKPSTAAKGAIFGIDNPDSPETAAYKRLMARSFKPDYSKTYALKGTRPMRMEVTHIVSNDIFLATVTTGTRLINDFIAVRGEGIWDLRKDKTLIPAKYVKYT